MNECRIEVSMLGPFSVSIDGCKVSFPYNKVKILCAYLMTEKGVLCRRELAEMLWPGMGEYYSRQNLRQALAVLRRIFGDDYTRIFKASRQMLEFIGSDSCRIDLDSIKAVPVSDSINNVDEDTLGALNWCADVGGEFCRGMSATGCEAVEEWLSVRRHEYRALAIYRARKLVSHYMRLGDESGVVEMYRQMISIDMSDERLLGEFKRYLHESGSRQLAAREHSSCEINAPVGRAGLS